MGEARALVVAAELAIAVTAVGYGLCVDRACPASALDPLACALPTAPVAAVERARAPSDST